MNLGPGPHWRPPRAWCSRAFVRPTASSTSFIRKRCCPRAAAWWAIGTPPQLARLESLVGPVSGDSLQMHWEGFEKRRFFVSRKDLVGIPLRELRLDARGIVISRLRRGDVEISIDGSTRLQLGDRVRAVFRSGEEAAVARLFGDSITVSSETVI